MREASGRDDCDRCHAPLRAVMAEDSPVPAEGVTCDVCHTLSAVTPDPGGTSLEFGLSSVVRYGPLCDVKDHYFHRMGCSPLHSESTLCGGCHWWTSHTPGSEPLELLSTYADWRDGPYAAAGQTCQGCHMHAAPGEVAVGWGSRPSASDHSMFGEDDQLRRRAVGLDLQVEVDGRQLGLDLELTNEGAGHAVPTGLPGHRLVTRVTTLGPAGEPLDQQERIYGRVLVDGAGRQVPFYAAVREQSDTRLSAQEVRRERFTFASADVVEVRVEVFLHALSDEIAEVLGVTAPEPVRLSGVRAIGRPSGQWEVVAR